jgi:hypothetical protein
MIYLRTLNHIMFIINSRDEMYFTLLRSNTFNRIASYSRKIKRFFKDMNTNLFTKEYSHFRNLFL